MKTNRHRVTIRSLVGVASLAVLLAACGRISIDVQSERPDLSGVWADEPLLFPSKTDGESI